MLAQKMYERRAEELRRGTIAIANGIGIGMGGSDAYRKWQQSQDDWSGSGAPRRPGPDSGAPGAAAQLGTIMRLQQLYGSQNPKSALRDAIRVKKAD